MDERPSISRHRVDIQHNAQMESAFSTWALPFSAERELLASARSWTLRAAYCLDECVSALFSSLLAVA